MATRNRKLRIAHILKHNKGRQIPKNVIFFDTETKETNIDQFTKELSLKLGYAISTRYYKTRGFVKHSE